jgi:hypothetical protein
MLKSWQPACGGNLLKLPEAKAAPSLLSPEDGIAKQQLNDYCNLAVAEICASLERN